MPAAECLWKYRYITQFTNDSCERKSPSSFRLKLCYRTEKLSEKILQSSAECLWEYIIRLRNKLKQLEMWANAHRDGRPAEYRWRPLFNAAKFGWRPLLDCCVVKLPRRETRLNLQGCPKLPDRSQPLLGRNSPYCEDIWRRYCCFTSFFRLSIGALVAKI